MTPTLSKADREALIASKYVSLEIAGCVEHPDHTEGLVPADRAEFFTVYGLDAEGMAHALVDLEPGRDVRQALAFARALAAPVGIPVALHRSLNRVRTAPVYVPRPGRRSGFPWFGAALLTLWAMICLGSVVGVVMTIAVGVQP